MLQVGSGKVFVAKVDSGHRTYTYVITALHILQHKQQVCPWRNEAETEP